MSAISGRAANAILDLDDDEPVVILSRPHLATTTADTQNNEVSNNQ